MVIRSRATPDTQLFLLFSRNGKLTTWKNSGYLTREETYYQHLLKAFPTIKWITYGGSEDTKISSHIKNITVLNNKTNLFGKIVRISFRNDRTGKYLGLFSLRYWNIK